MLGDGLGAVAIAATIFSHLLLLLDTSFENGSDPHVRDQPAPQPAAPYILT